MSLAVGKALAAAPALAVFGLSWATVELAERIHSYRRARRERAQLLAMSERELRDLGLSRIDALRLANQPMWRNRAKPGKATP
jgi:uncharacterized protein YjiS (DUF1127 family)